jgi:hypothetical protein
MTERDGDRENARPLPCRYAIETAYQLREEVVGIEVLDDQLQECTRPREFRRASGERPDRAGTKLLSPSIGLLLLLRPCGFFQETIDVDDGGTDLAHGSSDWRRAQTHACRLVRRAWAVRVSTVGVEGSARMCACDPDQG